MTTHDATLRLREIRDSGSICPCTECPECRASAALSAAVDYGRRWEWSYAGRALASAYEALGATPPDASGYDWHAGTHPIQLAAVRP